MNNKKEELALSLNAALSVINQVFLITPENIKDVVDQLDSRCHADIKERYYTMSKVYSFRDELEKTA